MSHGTSHLETLGPTWSNMNQWINDDERNKNLMFSKTRLIFSTTNPRSHHLRLGVSNGIDDPTTKAGSTSRCCCAFNLNTEVRIPLFPNLSIFSETHLIHLSFSNHLQIKINTWIFELFHLNPINIFIIQ
jgi:hypothetical protein